MRTVKALYYSGLFPGLIIVSYAGQLCLFDVLLSHYDLTAGTLAYLPLLPVFIFLFFYFVFRKGDNRTLNEYRKNGEPDWRPFLYGVWRGLGLAAVFSFTSIWLLLFIAFMNNRFAGL